MCAHAYAHVTKPIALRAEAEERDGERAPRRARWRSRRGSPGANGRVISAPSAIAQVVSSRLVAAQQRLLADEERRLCDGRAEHEQRAPAERKPAVAGDAR